MKKKTISLEKKLTLNKETVAFLNDSQKNSLAGGLPTTTVLPTRLCGTLVDTCSTIPPGQMLCIAC
ncbi:MAG: class I lanthipeptide [Chitinophaga sp.]|uniref:class I lanthipeptide n=1 Tax=Chitinophaga sp. TaxID=1869181 RepID=UPI0025BF2B8A|nr:class I lanthipeptide [Chitinophaga sp.]MBV8253000.1 class I lanthipeptide [Chitinophaga sp.]